MAHYIDIDKIEYRKGVLLDSEENPLPIIHKVATIEVIRDWTPKADVVERSKIDKAIAEIENAKMYRGNPKGLHNDIGLDRYFDKGLMKAIEILKRNLGGEM